MALRILGKTRQLFGKVLLKPLHPSVRIEKRLRDSLDRQIKLMTAELQPIANSDLPAKEKYARLWKAADKWEQIFEKLGHEEGRQMFRDSFDKVHSSLVEQLVDKMSVNVDVQWDDERFSKLYDDSIAQATSLIRSIPRQYIGDVEKAILTYERQQPLPEGRTLWQQIQRTGGVTRWRAQFLARDQTSKVNAAVTQFQHEAAGVKEYVWRTARDSRVVGNPAGRYPTGSRNHGDHYHRDGKIFRWDKPPSDGHPGQAINCRCIAIPVLDKGKARKNG